MKSRRHFLKEVCPTVAFAFFGLSFLEACSSGDDDVATTNPNTGSGTGTGADSGYTKDGNTYTIDLTNSNFSAIGNVGGWMNGNNIGIGALLLRISETEISGYTNKCPHLGRRDSWSSYNSTTGKFNCTAHGNSYADDCTTPGNGGVLKCFNTNISGDTLTLTIS